MNRLNEIEDVSSNTTEQLIHHLCAKLASNLMFHREEYIDSSYKDSIRLFCSTSYGSVDDAFELIQKIKQKLVNKNRIAYVSAFTDFESRFLKTKFIRNHAGVLQFFLSYFELDEKDSNSQNDHLLFENHSIDVPLTNHVNQNIIDEKSPSKQLVSLLQKENLFKVKNSVEDQRQTPNTSFYFNEGLILRELLTTLQGAEETLFQKDTEDFSLSIKPEIEKNIERSVRMQIYRFLEYGWLYLKLREFLNMLNRSSNGLVPQVFGDHISSELKEYHRLLAVLESQLDKNDEGIECNNLTLRRLLVWLEQPMDRLKYINIVCDAVRNQNGGIFLSTLYSHSQHGDTFKSSLVKSALTKCIIPIRDMIVEWICDGLIRDSYDEFFVHSKKDAIHQWNQKYYLIEHQIPSFISHRQAVKILIIGKSINFLRTVCNENTQLKQVKKLPPVESILDQDHYTEFSEMIDNAYVETNNYLLEILINKYKLLDYFTAIRRFLLLGQGDFIRHLMDLSISELDKSAEQLSYPNLKGFLDKAIHETNARYELPEILAHIDIRILTISPGDKGWDVFSLNFLFNGPLKTIFTPQVVDRYLRVFNFLWRVKRMEYTICQMWSNQKSDMERFRTMPKINDIIHQGTIITSEILRLIQNINHYIMFEVLEISWNKLSENIKKANDMDEVIHANEDFLCEIYSSLLLDETKTAEKISSEMRKIFNIIVEMTSLNYTFYKVACKEYQARASYIEKEKHGLVSDNHNEMEKDRYNSVEQKISSYRNQMIIHGIALTDLDERQQQETQHAENLKSSELPLTLTRDRITQLNEAVVDCITQNGRSFNDFRKREKIRFLSIAVPGLFKSTSA